MTILTVRHVTTYRYRRPVALGEHRMMFRPRDSYDQRLVDSRLRITPEPVHLHWIHDPFGNCVALARFKTRTSELRFESTIRVDHYPDNVPDFQTDPRAKTYPFVYDADEMPDLMASIARGYPDPDGEIDHWVRRFLLPGRPTPTGKLLMTLTSAIKEGFSYTRRSEHGTQDPVGDGADGTRQLPRLRAADDGGGALARARGAIRVGLSLRSVARSLRRGRRPCRRRTCGGQHVGGGSTHAWCQVYLPGAGWVEFDPTNGIIGNRDLIRVAVARDPSQAIPLSGTYAGSPDDELGMKVQVHVTRDADAGD